MEFIDNEGLEKCICCKKKRLPCYFSWIKTKRYAFRDNVCSDCKTVNNFNAQTRSVRAKILKEQEDERRWINNALLLLKIKRSTS